MAKVKISREGGEGKEGELKLGLIQSHMAQKPVLRGEVGARALRVRSVSRGGHSERGVQVASVSGCGCYADQGMLYSRRPCLLRCSPRRAAQSTA